MATVGHIAIGFAAGRAQSRSRHDLVAQFILYGALSALPDVDLLASALHHRSMLSHRGPTHSLLFAGVVAGLVALVAPRLSAGLSRGRTWLVVFAATASHGLIDPLVVGSRATPIFWPFSPWRLSWGFQFIPETFAGFRWPYLAPWPLVLELLLFSPFLVYALWPRQRTNAIRATFVYFADETSNDV